MSSKQARAAALAALKAAKSGKSKLSHLVKEEDAELYRDVSEEEYRALVAKRREGDDFVEDDNGLGYADDGEEHFSGESGVDDGDEADDADGDVGEDAEDGAPQRRQKKRVVAAAPMFQPLGAMLSRASTGGAGDAPRAAKPGSAAIDLDSLLEGAYADVQGEAASSLTAAFSSAAATSAATSGLGLNPFARGVHGNMHDDFEAAYAVPADGEVEDPGATEAARHAPAADGASRVTTAAVAGAAPRARVRLAATSAPSARPAPALAAPAAPAPAVVPFAQATADASLAAVSGTAVSSEDMDRSRANLPPLPMLPVRHRKLGDTSELLFYWLDAYEEMARPGSLHLFGKVMTNAPDVLRALRHNDEVRRQVAGQGVAPIPQPMATFASACVTVSGLERCMFVLPRATTAGGEAVELMDVYREISEVLRSHMGSGATFKAKPVTRSYAFELADVPRHPAQYLKVVFSAKFRPLPKERMSGRTYSHIFGVSTSPLEQFLLKRGLMGPSWLRLAAARETPELYVSYCKYDIAVDDPKLVSKYGAAPKAPKAAAGAPAPAAADATSGPGGVASGTVTSASGVGAAAAAAPMDPPLPTPPLVVVSLAMKTIVDPKRHTHEIAAVSLYCHRAVDADRPTDENPSESGIVTAKTIVRPLNGEVLNPELRARIGRLPPNIRSSLCLEGSERALLNHVLSAVFTLDPDILVGHNIAGFDLDVLLHRIESCKAQLWARLGRLRRSAMPQSSRGPNGRTQYMGVLTAGRLVCDTYLAAREFLMKETTYTMTALAKGHLDYARKEIDPLDVPRYLGGGASAEAVLGLMEHTQIDAQLAIKLMFRLQVLPLTKQLTNVSGNLWARSLKGARAERIEYLLLHEFHRLKYIVPDKLAYGETRPQAVAAAAVDDDVPDGMDDDDDDHGGRGAGGGGGRVGTGNIARNAKKRAKPAYSGGLVLEPKKGLYDKFVLLLDFNSLYPSIIQEYNICFTTVERPLYAQSAAASAPAQKKGKAGVAGAAAPPREPDDADDDVGEAAAGGALGGSSAVELPQLPDRSKYPDLAVLPTVIQALVRKRQAVKRMLKSEQNPVAQQALDIRQKALKILANSMYGCLGFAQSRFYARPLAALVTAQGREILQRTCELAQDTAGLEVVYGDTDSIFLATSLTDYAQARAKGEDVKRAVNKLYRHLEIEIDNVFASLLLLKKKKYAALAVTGVGPGGEVRTEREVKGLDLVRRDWCVLSRDFGSTVLDALLSGKEREEIVDAVHASLTALGEDMRAGRIPLDKFVITRGLNKAPMDYPDAKGQPHLQVALAMIKAGRTVNVGDHIPFVICIEPIGSVAASTPGATPSVLAPLGTGDGFAPPAAAVAADASPAGTPGLAPPPVRSALGGSPAGVTAPSPATSAAASPREEVATTTPDKALAGGGGGIGGGSSGPVSFASRAYHPEEVRKSGGRLHLDIEWYLTNQILPPVARLCEPIEGTSQARLAQCLGLDASRFAGIGGRGAGGVAGRDDGFVPRYTMLDEERFRDCDPVMVTCASCNSVSRFAGAFSEPSPASLAGSTNETLPFGLICALPGCGGVLLPISVGGFPAPLSGGQQGGRGAADAILMTPTLPPGVPLLEVARTRLVNLVTMAIRMKLGAYMSGTVACDDHMCGHTTRVLSARLDGYACTRPGCRGRVALVRDSASLHLWLEYLSSLFSVSRCRKRRARQLADAPHVHIPTLPPEHAAVLAEAEAVVQGYLVSSAYHFVPHGIFDYVKRVNELAGIRVEAAAGKKGSRRSGAAAGAGAGGPPGEAKRARIDPEAAAASAVGAGMLGLQED